jgi:hypothetical protein
MPLCGDTPDWVAAPAPGGGYGRPTTWSPRLAAQGQVFQRIARWSPRIMATRQTKASQSHLDQLLHISLPCMLTPMATTALW